MSQRYPPPRDRSPPPRQFDRRTSSTYVPLSSSSSYRPANDSSQAALERPPPRGPRAESFRGGFTFSSAPRGRGAAFAPRGGDSWDRERDRERERERERDRDRDRDREVRNLSGGFRRDDDRPDWSRRDERAPPPPYNRDRSYVGRERSASPARPRRDSKESIGPAFGRSQDVGPAYLAGSATRGASDRGRGRGAYDRIRGRSSFVNERDRDRDLFATRSRSREGWRERDYVDRPRGLGPEPDRTDRYERREYDRPFDREPRGRDHDIWQRDPSPGRSSAGNRAPSPGALSSISQDRGHKAEYDPTRKPLATSSLISARDGRREVEADYFSSRNNDGLRREPSFPQAAPTPSVPQSASAGLDYGPPPAATPVTPAPSEKPLPPSKPLKSEPSPATSLFQPPSGPKAERTVNVAAPSQLPTAVPPTVEQQTKTDTSISIDRGQAQEFPARSGLPQSDPVNDAQHDRSALTAAQNDRPLPPNVPSGPRLGTSMVYKPKTSPIAQHMSLTSVGQKPNTDARGMSNVPTGPRNSSLIPPSGPRASLPSGPSSSRASMSATPWDRRPQIEYRPPRPSIMNNMNKPQMTVRSPKAAMQALPRQSPKPAGAQLSDANRAVQSHKPLSPRIIPSLLDNADDDTGNDVEMSQPVSEDEEGDDEPDSELDENYFADSENKHAREMEQLKFKKPPPLLEDTMVVNLLIRIQLLGMIVEGIVPPEIQPTDEVKDTDMLDRPAASLISPDQTPPELRVPTIEHPRPRGRPLKEPPVNPIPTPPVEDLPYCGPRADALVVFDEPVEDEVEDEKITDMLRNQFERDAWDEKEDLAELLDFYRQKYPEWKYEIDKYERLRRELEATPDPGSPGAQSSVSIPPSAERLTGRAARNATEFDIEKAILMSQQSAREEEEKREREAAANAQPNYDVEAVVPNMLKPSERDPCWRFQDTNALIPIVLSVDLMQYVPPEDDFTEDEQAKFIIAFCQTPKKWGLIADQIPGRSYQECILHYYLTKNEANYKELWRRAQPKRKRGRAATKPRSTALLSDMALNEDPDSTPVPVTDSGRPRRAAAPTFGDTPDAEAGALPAAKRLAVTPKDGSDTATPKASKGRKAGTATKVRRTKAQILADQQAALAQAGVDLKPGVGRARALAAAKGENNTNVGVLRPDVEAQQLTSLQVNAAAGPLRQRTPPPPVVTSYWSVPEQTKFRQLVGYYGRDYGRIADFMKTKSQAMIKNHYSREVTRGDTDLERMAQAAEDKIARGEPLGRPPSPIAPPKRKYDATPSMQPRPLTASTEATLDAERAALPPKASHVEDFPANVVHRDANGSLVAKPSPRSELLHNSPHHPPLQAKVEDYPRDRTLLAQKVSGPQRGLFMHEEPLFHQTLQQRHPYSNDPVLHHHPPHVVDLRGGEMPASQIPGSTREMLSRGREPLISSQSSLQQPLFRGMDGEKSLSSGRQTHSRNQSLTNAAVSAAEQRVSELSAVQGEQRRLMPFSTQSPRLQALQSGIPPRQEPYSAYAPQHQQPLQQVSVKQDPPKPAPAKRSNVFGLLNNDEPPERPLKRSSTDSTNRMSIQTPPPQPAAPSAQPFGARPQDDLARSGLFGSSQTSHRSITDLRMYSNSPAPSHRQETWVDKFDPRRDAVDRAHNQSPSYSVVPPAPSSTKPPVHDSLRSLEPNGARRGDLGRPQMSSPPRQISTPVPQFRSASTAPQHNRMSSLGFSQNLAPESRSQQQGPSGISQYQPSVSHPPSAGNTPISALHRRGEPSADVTRRLTIQEYKATNLDPPRDPRDVVDARHRDEAVSQHRQIAPPPSSAQFQDSSRQPDHRDMYRSEPVSHQVPPPPSRTSQFNSPFAPPSRAFTPPIQGFGSDPRTMPAHNQHAHQHHQNLAPQHQQPPPPQTQHHHHQQPQPQLGLPPHGHQNLTAHPHQPPQLHQQQPPPGPGQYRQDQMRFGQPQGLAPPPPSGHYRGYSSDERR